MSFDGQLIRLGGSASATPFPLKYAFANSYKITPNRRQDLDSKRNANGKLERNVLDHTASTITLTIKPLMNKDLAKLMNLLKSKYSIEKERKIKLYYYCPDLDDYKVGNFYIPDIEFPIMQVYPDKKEIRYATWSLEFIEY